MDFAACCEWTGRLDRNTSWISHCVVDAGVMPLRSHLTSEILERSARLTGIPDQDDGRPCLIETSRGFLVTPPKPVGSRLHKNIEADLR